MPTLRASKTCLEYLDHALTGVAIDYRPFGPLMCANRRQQFSVDLIFPKQRSDQRLVTSMPLDCDYAVAGYGLLPAFVELLTARLKLVPLSRRRL